MLTSAWVRQHPEEFDLMHIHFGFDAVSPEDLTDVVTALREHAKPLVLTVHDLRNPHHRTVQLHDAARGPGRCRRPADHPDVGCRVGHRGALGA